MNFEKEPIIIHIDSKYVYPHNCKLICSNGNQHIFFLLLRNLQFGVSAISIMYCVFVHILVCSSIYTCVCVTTSSVSVCIGLKSLFSVF